MRRSDRFICAGTLITLAISGCGGGDKGGPSGPTPAISIGLSKTAMTIVQGGSESLVATVSRTGGFTGTVAISVEGVPAGVTGAVSNVSTTGGVSSGTVTVSVAANVTPGSYNVVVRATGAGVTAVTATATLTVAPTPAIGISLASASIPVNQGSSGQVVVTITRINYASDGEVDLSLEGAPTGMTGSFNPPISNGPTSTLTINVGAAVAEGTYHLIVHADGTAVETALAALDVVVSVPHLFTMTVSPATIAVGASGPSNIVLTRTNFTGDVTLDLEGEPTGVTGSFAPTPVSLTTSTLTITVGAGVAPAVYPMSVRGTATGLADVVVEFALTVVPVTGGYTLAVSPVGSVTVAQGGGVAVPISIVRTGGFTAPVTLSVNEPIGLTTDITSTPVTGGVAPLSIVADGSAAIASYPLTVTGTSPGLANQTVAINAVVAVPNVSLVFPACGFNAPRWIAVQNGVNAEWVEVTAVGGSYKTIASQPKVGIAIVTINFGGVNSLLVNYMTGTELQNTSGATLCLNPTLPTRSATVSTVGLVGNAIAQVNFGGAGAFLTSSAPGGTLSNILPGTHDLVSHYGATGNSFSAADRIIIRRDLNPPDGGSLGAALNFSSLEAFAPVTATITVDNLLSGESLSSVGTSYVTGASCVSAPLWYAFPFSATPTFPAHGVPAANQRPTDFHGILVTGFQTVTAVRQVIEYRNALTDRTVSLPSVLPAPTITTVADEYQRLRFQFTAPPDLASRISANYQSAGRVVNLSATSGWLGGSAVTLELPGFGSTAEWDDSWAPQSPPTTQWSLSAIGSSGTPCTEGSRSSIAIRTGSL